MAKQWESVYDAVIGGSNTSAAVSEALGLPLSSASRCLYELEAMGMLERASRSPRNGKGTHGGGGVIAWRPKK